MQENRQKFKMLRYALKVQPGFKTKKHNNFEYFDQVILMQRRNLKLINFQASFSLFTLQFLLKTKKFQGMKKVWCTYFHKNNTTL